MDIIGERWALMIIRELIFGPKRFGDIRAGLPGLSANVLTQRLEALEAAGIVQRRKLPPPASVQIYELTEWGAESEILFRIIGRWAARSPLLTPAFMSVASVVLSMRTMFDTERARDFDADIGFRFGAEHFRATVKDGTLTIEPGETDGADVVFSGDQNALVAMLYGGEALAPLESSGAVGVEGDPALFARYLTLFPLPEQAVPGNLPRQRA
ncbi:winged helix-turn-helix transcriptional regulator [Sphingobium subterraneum]|uniref:DNA-binding HxlR family transcriptional regulator n=1 Tax=Sphingobium subterraneum TaxID=627688 RepID=A0A841JA08_9SPHN|nr:winged helix-turn-helix transcriptional regulator [Sphingobium subterraneum]MBB6124981.1 DNA-binding HxlR family transcriptional regulator [Sphingobium subterraneum]